MPYPTTAELVAASSKDELVDLDATQQDALRAASIREVERYTRQSFLAEDTTINVQGDGSGLVWLPRRAQLVTGVTVNGAPVDLANNLALDDLGAKLFYLPPSNDYAMQATREPGEVYRRVFKLDAQVSITGTFGWTDVPEDVVTAIRYDMEDQAATDASGLAGTVAMARKLGIRDTSQGNLRVTLADARGRTLSVRSEALLGDLVWTGPPGYVV